MAKVAAVYEEEELNDDYDPYNGQEPPYADKLRAALKELERGEVVRYNSVEEMFAAWRAESDANCDEDE